MYLYENPKAADNTWSNTLTYKQQHHAMIKENIFLLEKVQFTKNHVIQEEGKHNQMHLFELSRKIITMLLS